MREAVHRRYQHPEDGMPDLILVDGGEGHVSVVRAQLEADGIDIPVFGMVKDSFHKTRAITDGEREISIARSREVYNLIFRIQEEVHRFTVSRMSGSSAGHCVIHHLRQYRHRSRKGKGAHDAFRHSLGALICRGGFDSVRSGNNPQRCRRSQRVF